MRLKLLFFGETIISIARVDDLLSLWDTFQVLAYYALKKVFTLLLILVARCVVVFDVLCETIYVWRVRHDVLYDFDETYYIARVDGLWAYDAQTKGMVSHLYGRRRGPEPENRTNRAQSLDRVFTTS